MTVLELISLLQQQPQDATVFVAIDDLVDAPPALREVEGVTEILSSSYGQGISIDLED
ncbi:hypothetical protein [Dechloromonas denitrificans]|uniref:hypothetical protein n=1 Tax=Dechloromonas denitrificans TaxID=281362 RepID=UPI001CF84CC4|nr:hypothetical protein [Dechloromonas denitrificans]UCV02331.1 hypothetical protein KI611_14695 [Dechloromonas denitrificans]